MYVAGEDFVAGPYTVAFSAGEGELIHPIATLNDTVFEGTIESFQATIVTSSLPSEISVANGTATVNIREGKKVLVICAHVNLTYKLITDSIIFI